MKSIDILTKANIDYNMVFYEDNMVGRILNDNNIFPYHYKTYYDNMEYEQGCIQNHNNCKFLYIMLHGGLGNEQFQLSAAYDLAKKNQNKTLNESLIHKNS
jgi:hypothetical protein